MVVYVIMLLYWGIVYSTPETANVEQLQTIMTALAPVNNPGLSVAIIGAVVGGLAGLLFVFMLALVLFLSLTLVWIKKKHKRVAVNNTLAPDH